MDTGKKPQTPDVPVQHNGPTLPLLRSPEKCPVAWAIAGFDPSSGAGVTADLMTFAAHGIFGCSAITALTVQSTMGVFGCEPVSPKLFRETLECLQQDLPFAGAKIGMLATPAHAVELGAFLADVRGSALPGTPCPVVLDPVLRSSSGRALFPEEGIELLHECLLPMVDWITPNWGELALLARRPVCDASSAVAAAEALIQTFPRLRIVATGGDQTHPDDLLISSEEGVAVFKGERVETSSTHGTGCAFSSALLCALLYGADAVHAVEQAKRFVQRGLSLAPGLGHGRGPLDLLWPLRAETGAGGPAC